MTTFVLVHGAWHDGSSWDAMKWQLVAQRNAVHAPTMAGHGHGANKQVGVECAGRVDRPRFGWQAMYFIGGLPLILFFVLCKLVPESPRWLAGWLVGRARARGRCGCLSARVRTRDQGIAAAERQMAAQNAAIGVALAA
jgi:hypothetical protein